MTARYSYGFRDMPPAQMAEIERVCVEFEHMYTLHKRPRIEDYLIRVEDSLRTALLRALLQMDLEYRRQNGEHVEIDDYKKRFPSDPSLIEGAFESVAPLPLPPDFASCFPNYEVRKELGRGGMGVVYLVLNKSMDRLEAMKVIGNDAIARHDARARFLQEIRTLGKFQHPNITIAFHVEEFRKNLFLFMEYVQGYDLATILESRKRLTVAHACHFAYQTALGLQHAHDNGIVHRDIKPANLMVSSDRKKAVIKILDFGLAKAMPQGVGAGLTSDNRAFGTPMYMAPEQFENARQADIRVDIYSLGCTLYHCLSGEPPFNVRGNPFELYRLHRDCHAQRLNLIRPDDVPDELAAIVGKMMAKSPGERFQAPAEVARVLKPFFQTSDKENDVLTDKEARASENATGPLRRADSVATITSNRNPSLQPQEQRVDGAHSRAAESIGPRRLGPIARSSPISRAVFAVGLLVVGIVAALMGGIFDVKVKTPEGLIVLKGLPQGADVLVDGDKISLTWPGENKPVEIRAVIGERKLEVIRGGVRQFGRKVTVRANESTQVTAVLEPTPDRGDVNSIGMKFVLIPAGEFEMGSFPDAVDSEDHERPKHRVQISNPFYLGTYEVTQQEYQKVVGETPTGFKFDAALPVDSVTWFDAIRFCNAFSLRERLQPCYDIRGAEVKFFDKNNGYRLPTEAEWEFACRAGTTTRFSFGDDPAPLADHAWYNANSDNHSHPVGEKKPNSLKLYDMHGNVGEWCWDMYDERYYRTSPRKDPTGPTNGQKRVIRGAGWYRTLAMCSSAYRGFDPPLLKDRDLGFRVARTASTGAADRQP